MSDPNEQETDKTEEQASCETPTVSNPEAVGPEPDLSPHISNAPTTRQAPEDKGGTLTSTGPGPRTETIAAQDLEHAQESEAERERRRQAADAQVLSISSQHTRRAFLGAAAASAAGFGLYRYLNLAPSENMQPVPLENAYKFNAAVSRTLFQNKPLAPTYPLSRAETLRINGVYGLKKDIIPESWRLQVVGMKNASRHPRFVPM